MSIIGTGVAAGVASSQHTAQQVSRKQKKDSDGAADEARRVKDIVECIYKRLDEGDESGNTAAQVRIDNQVPEHQKSPGDAVDAIQQLAKDSPDRAEISNKGDATEGSSGADKETGADGDDGDDRPGLSHVDLTA